MNEVYRYIGYSKQAFHQKMNRKLLEHEQEWLLVPIIAELRREHPGVAARQLYQILEPENMGRDKFERICFEHGLKLDRTKAFKRTTDSTGVIRFPNLIAGMEFTDINQAWSSDITYYQIGETFYYITFIIDLLSRRIIGFSVSKRLLTVQTTIPALQMAMRDRNPSAGLIFHSDGGGQYYCKEFLKLTEAYKIKNSMCDVVYENAHAERINGTIKNQYLKGYNPENYLSLVKMTGRAVKNYNTIRPHKSLKKMTPAAFEKILPAGGSSLSNDNFCIFRNQSQHYQKNYHLPTRSILDIKKEVKAVKKTVNVF
jgi:transposase InsO family protein